MSQITAILLIHDQLERTLQALQGLTRAHFDGDVILVDQASSDGCAEKAGAFLESRLPYHVLRHDTNLPYAIAANRAAAMARGDKLLFLDNDTVLAAGALAQLLSTIEQEESIAAAGPKLLYPSGQIQEAGLALPLWLVPFPVGVNARGSDHRYNCPRPAFALSTSCLLVKRAAFEQVGGFNEKLVWGFESADLGLALREKRLKVYYEPRAICLHEGGATLGNFPELTRTDDNRAHFLDRWGVSLLKRVSNYLDRLAQEGPRRFLIFGTGDSGRHLANTLEVGGYEVAGFLSPNGVRVVGSYPAWNIHELPADLEARVLIGSPYVREAEDHLAEAGLLSGAALPILLD